MHFRMERQQLRHDEKMANQKLAERERIDDVFKAIYGVLPLDVEVSNNNPQS